MAYQYACGAGTYSDPYQIWTPADLNGVRENLSAHYIQRADINLGAYPNWIPIGTASSPFTGVYDGNGKTINGLVISSSAIQYVGLFGLVDQGALLKNISLVNVNIVSTYNTTTYVAALAGTVRDSDVLNCSCSGAVSSECGYSGGITGLLSYGSIRYCHSSCAVTISTTRTYSFIDAGGIAGAVGTSVVTNSYATGNVTATANSTIYVHIGGLVGSLTSVSSVVNCYSTGKPSITTSCRAGSSKKGMIGEVLTSSVVTSCYYDTVTSTLSDNYGGGVPKTTAEMGMQSTFLGWDFNDTWDIDGGYPILIMSPNPQTIEIWTAQDLYNVRNCLTNNYIQMADIDLSAYPDWDVITKMYERFLGNYDGNGKTISNLTINSSDPYEHVGLFGQIGQTSVIRNVTLLNVAIVSQGESTGSLIGTCYGTVVGCHSEGSVSSSDSVFGSHNIGGLIGIVDGPYCVIADCYNNCDVSTDADSTSFGGLIGYVYVGTVINCYNTGSVSGGEDYVGGLIGEVYCAEIKDCYNTGSVSGTGYCIGGLTGYAYMSTITDCYCRKNAGVGVVNGVETVGGLVGCCDGTTIRDCYTNLDVAGAGNAIGGLSGDSYGGDISSSFSMGNVLNSEGYCTGGLIGYVSDTTISDCYSMGDVSGDSEVGGLIGEADGGSYTNCYSMGAVSSVTGDPYVGGLIGEIYGSISITSCYYDSEVSGLTDTGKGEPRTTAEMRTRSNYVNWDFSTPVWIIVRSVNDGYPTLLVLDGDDLLKVNKPKWVGYSITWKDVPNANSYQVTLYRNDEIASIKTVPAGVQFCDFSNVLLEGTYTATVRAMPGEV